MLAIRALLVHRNKLRNAAAAEAGVTVDHLHAFEDLTDKMNPDFRCETTHSCPDDQTRFDEDLYV
jgi:hypothetical protein